MLAMPFRLLICKFIGGTAAGVIAARLLEADQNLKILILEGGPTTKGKPEHVQPGQFLTHLAPGSNTMQFYESRPSPKVGGRSIVVPSGRCVGGGELTRRTPL